MNRFTYALNNPTGSVDPTGLSANQSSVLRSAGTCFTGSIGAGVLNVFGGYASASVCQVIDVSGRRSIMFALGGGEIVGISASATGGPIASNGMIGDLGKWFSVQGGSVGDGGTVGGEVSHTADNSTVIASLFAGVAAKLPIPGEFHSGDSYTWIVDEPLADILAATSPLIPSGWIVRGAILQAAGRAGG